MPGGQQVSADQELSPEEKLLKVIQEEDGSAEDTPVASEATPPASSPEPVVAGATPEKEVAKKAPVAKAAATAAKVGKVPAAEKGKAGAKTIGKAKPAEKKVAAKSKPGAGKKPEKVPAPVKKVKKKGDDKAATSAAAADAAAEASREVPSGTGTVRKRGGVFRTVNITLVAAAVLLAGALVWEIFAARQTIPAQPEAQGLSQSEVTTVPLGSEKEHVELFRLRDPWLWMQRPTTTSTVTTVISGGFGEVAQYVKQNMLLDGVSLATEDESGAAALTDRRRGETYFLAVGHPVPILGLIPSTEPQKLTLGNVRDNGVTLSYDDQGKSREIHIQLR